MHGRYPLTAKSTCITFSKILDLLQDKHTCASVTPSKQPTETDVVVALKKMHQGKIMCAGRVYLLSEWLYFGHFQRRFEVGDAGQSYVRLGLVNNQDDIMVWRCLMELTRGGLEDSKTSLFAGRGYFFALKYASVAMVRLVGGKKRAPEIGPETS